jgi:hypothetical protein
MHSFLSLLRVINAVLALDRCVGTLECKNPENWPKSASHAEHFLDFFTTTENPHLNSWYMRSFLSLLGALDAALASFRFAGTKACENVDIFNTSLSHTLTVLPAPWLLQCP